ncbi:MAG TPA: tetratricopeptide repeat protein, partial [Chroococcales cyanobacterium]
MEKLKSPDFIPSSRKLALLTSGLLFMGSSCLVAAAEAAKAAATWQELIVRGDQEIAAQHLLPAEKLYREALQQVEHGPHTDLDEISCLEKLAAALVLEDKTEEAVKLYRKSLHMLEAKYGKSSIKVVPTLFALGSIYESEGNPEISMPLYKRAMTINERNYGPYSP